MLCLSLPSPEASYAAAPRAMSKCYAQDALRYGTGPAERRRKRGSHHRDDMPPVLAISCEARFSLCTRNNVLSASTLGAWTRQCDNQ